jgi:hypothetical protein
VNAERAPRTLTSQLIAGVPGYDARETGLLSVIQPE